MCIHTLRGDQICDECSKKAWDQREGHGIGHRRRTEHQAPRDVRERERKDRQAARIKEDRDLLKR
jgi:hypothetical protein